MGAYHSVLKAVSSKIKLDIFVSNQSEKGKACEIDVKMWRGQSRPFLDRWLSNFPQVVETGGTGKASKSGQIWAFHEVNWFLLGGQSDCETF